MKDRTPWALAAAALVSTVPAGSARGELLAHWKFESDAPYDDAVSRLHLNVEASGNADNKRFKVTAGKPPLVKEGKGSLVVPFQQGVDLRLRVNAPTRGGNPFRLAGSSWTISGWFQHSGDKPTRFGHVIAGTNGYSPLEGRGMAGWSLRVVGEGEDKHKLAAIFSSGGEKPITFPVASAEVIATGEGKWNHFALAWDHGGGKAGGGVARLFVNGKLAGEAEAPANFVLATADRNAFRGIWMAGRPTSKAGQGSDNWSGRLDEIKFFAETVADEAMALAEMGQPKPEPTKTPATKPAGKPVAVAKPKVAAPPPPPKPVEKVLEVRTWTDMRGQTMEASMVIPVEPVEGRVLLQTEDRIRLSLPLERLSEGDGDYVASQQ